jgi:Uma2 family endonuclease
MSTVQQASEKKVEPRTALAWKVLPMTLRGIRYQDYVRLRDEPRNDHLRMTYHDGTLELMSPEARHETPARRFAIIIHEVTTEFELPCTPTGGATFRRGSARKSMKGAGREPDESFYLTNESRIIGKSIIDLDHGDPPPDLWIEVDNRVSSRGKLPVFADLGVPEVWRYRVKQNSLWFGRLVEGRYEPIDRSVALPMLTTALVLEALNMSAGVSGPVWGRRLRAWIREKLVPPSPGV